MPICTANILNEGLRDGWAYQLTDDGIRRILARYKEHVSFWNITIEVIRAELDGFAKAVGRDYMVIATLFDSLPPKRIVREL